MGKTVKMMRSMLLAVAVVVGLVSSALAAVSDTGFIDVEPNNWYSEAIEYCVTNELMSGTAEARFSPNDNMSRAMFATILYRLEGSPAITETSNFTDVPQGAWYTNPITWVAQEQITSGYSATFFGINDAVTREEIATILYRFEQHQHDVTAPSGSLSFVDADEIAPWAYQAVIWACEEGILPGRQGNLFDPKAGATRAEASVMLHRYQTKSAPVEPSVNENGTFAVNISVGNEHFAASFYDNETTRDLIKQMPLTLNMSDYNGQEKVCTLSKTPPSSSTEKPATIHEGELYIWSGDSLVLFYSTFQNSYGGYVPLGYIEDTSRLKTALGSGDVEVTFSTP